MSLRPREHTEKANDVVTGGTELLPVSYQSRNVANLSTGGGRCRTGSTFVDPKSGRHSFDLFKQCRDYLLLVEHSSQLMASSLDARVVTGEAKPVLVHAENSRQQACASLAPSVNDASTKSKSKSTALSASIDSTRFVLSYSQARTSGREETFSIIIKREAADCEQASRKQFDKREKR